MKYRIVEECETEELQSVVNHLINKGWEPLGGVSVSLSESDDFAYKTLTQALIHRGLLNNGAN